MKHFTERAPSNSPVAARVTLPTSKREKSRLRVTLDDGRVVGIIIARGECLKHGDKLTAPDGETIEVIAEKETLSIVNCSTPLQFARASYHLGNRHVPVQIQVESTSDATTLGSISYLHDHVLDDMLRGLEMQVNIISAPFEPEPGAYGGGHSHDHSHSHSLDHSDAHEH